MRLDGFLAGYIVHFLVAVGAVWLFSVTWQAGHIMVYSPLHPIQQVKGEKLTQVPALFKRTSPKTATILGFSFLCAALALSIYLGFYFKLNLLYFIPTILMALVALTLATGSCRTRKISPKVSKLSLTLRISC